MASLFYSIGWCDASTNKVIQDKVKSQIKDPTFPNKEKVNIRYQKNSNANSNNNFHETYYSHLANNWVDAFGALNPRDNKIVVSFENHDSIKAISGVYSCQKFGSIIKFTYEKDKSGKVYVLLIRADKIVLIEEL